jgi:hypothetical protein
MSIAREPIHHDWAIGCWWFGRKRSPSIGTPITRATETRRRFSSRGECRFRPDSWIVAGFSIQ